MNELAGFLFLSGNTIMWWLAARILYRRWRPGGACQLTHDISRSTYNTNVQPWSTGSVMIASMLVAILWPGVFMAVTIALGQPPTDTTLKARAKAAEKALDDKAKELELAERELGIVTAQMTEAVNGTPVSDAINVKKKNNRREWKDPLSKKVWHD